MHKSYKKLPNFYFNTDTYTALNTSY